MIKHTAVIALFIPCVALAQVNMPCDTIVDTVRVSSGALTMSLQLNPRVAAEYRHGRWTRMELRVVPVVDWLNDAAALSLTVPAHVPEADSVARPFTCAAASSQSSCADSTSLALADDRLVITMRDPAALGIVFADRPLVVLLRSMVLHKTFEIAAVQYVDPPILAPAGGGDTLAAAPPAPTRSLIH